MTIPSTYFGPNFGNSLTGKRGRDDLKTVDGGGDAIGSMEVESPRDGAAWWY